MSLFSKNIKKRFSWSGLSLLIISIALIWSMFNIKLWTVGEKCHRAVINQDVANYYSYLPATFIYKDLSFNFTAKEGTSFNINCEIWTVPVEGKEHSYVVKTSMGMAYMYLPFFLMAHAYTSNFSDYPANGYSPPYEFFLVLASVFYLILGFFFLRKLLLRFFPDSVVAAVIILTLFATNLFYYGSSEPAMSHAYSFTLFIVFAYISVLWIEKEKWQMAIGLGIIGGLITLIRPVNILVFIFPLLYSVNDFGDLKRRAQFCAHNYLHIIIIGVSAFIVIFPQLLFWKMNSGHWVYYTYAKEHFYFGNPHIIDGLFSYRKGWLLYTPIMVFSILGIVISYFNNKRFFWPLAVYLPIHIYVTYSWWCWWYGGSFGSRPMVETYALLAFPMAVWIDWVRKRKATLIGFTAIAILLTGLNLFQTIQKRYASIHYDAMTKEAYWSNFGHRDRLPGFEELLDHPDYEKALKGMDESGS